MNFDPFSQENCSATVIQSLSEIICACIIWVGENEINLFYFVILIFFHY
jgi:hypothetical protein